MPAFTSTGFTEIGPALRFLRLHGTAGPAKQKEIAARAGVTKGMLSSYERSKQEPSLATLARLLEALGADLVQLQWALRTVASTHASVDSREAAAVDAAALEVAEPLPPYGSYRTVPVPEPLSEAEERALGQMLAGFLAYVRYTRGEGDAEDSAAAQGQGA